MVAIYAKKNKGYEMVDALTSLVPVENVSFTALPGSKNKAIIIDEALDEMVGAYYKVKSKSIYLFNGKTFTKLWERETYREEYFPEGYELKGDNTQWIMKRENVNVTFYSQGKILVSGEIVWNKGKELGDVHGDYKKTSVEKINEMYRWDKNKLIFEGMNIL